MFSAAPARELSSVTTIVSNTFCLRRRLKMLTRTSGGASAAMAFVICLYAHASEVNAASSWSGTASPDSGGYWPHKCEHLAAWCARISPGQKVLPATPTVLHRWWS